MRYGEKHLSSIDRQAETRKKGRSHCTTTIYGFYFELEIQIVAGMRSAGLSIISNPAQLRTLVWEAAVAVIKKGVNMMHRRAAA